MLSSKAILLLLWTFVATAALSYAAVLPASPSEVLENVDGDTATSLVGRQTCNGPESISNSGFLPAVVPALKESCLNLLNKLQQGGRATFVGEGGSDVRSDDGICTINWTSRDVDPAQVSFDDLVAPMAVAFFRGSDDNGRTGGVIKDYLLADVCTDVRVGFST